MQIKLDWLSFSFFQDENHYDNDKEAMNAAYDKLLQGMNDGGWQFFNAQRWEPAKGRKPYSIAKTNGDHSITVYANAKLPHALVEISGKGMARVLESPFAEKIIQACAERVTRIDLACDIETATDPIAFAEEREAGRFKSGSTVVSDSGTTVYVGSKTSNRYARVYRYAKPHPRHHLLRVEHVFKGDDAKNMLAYIVQRGYVLAAQQAQFMFGWKHSDWTIAPAAEREINAHREERGEAKTIFWLYDTVAPVLARLHKEGKLPFDQFVDEAIKPLIDPPKDE